MDMEKFIDAIADHVDLMWTEYEHEGKDGILVKNERLNTKTHFTKDSIESNDWDYLVRKTHHGKNVEHMTRVTGYMSKVSGWNGGKVGELKDRHRSEM